LPDYKIGWGHSIKGCGFKKTQVKREAIIRGNCFTKLIRRPKKKYHFHSPIIAEDLNGMKVAA
jgi:hypothetical protein